MSFLECPCSARRPRQLAAAEHMHVQVRHGLLPVPSHVDDDAVAAFVVVAAATFLEPLGPRNVGRSEEEPPEKRAVAGLCLRKAVDAPLGDDQDVHGCLWTDGWDKCQLRNGHACPHGRLHRLGKGRRTWGAMSRNARISSFSQTTSAGIFPSRMPSKTVGALLLHARRDAGAAAILRARENMAAGRDD